MAREVWRATRSALEHNQDINQCKTNCHHQPALSNQPVEACVHQLSVSSSEPPPPFRLIDDQPTYKEQKSQPVGDRGWANDLNLFFNRFDQVPTPPPAQSPLLLPPPLSVPATHCSSCPPSSPSLMNFSSHIPDTSHPGPCPSPPPTPPCSSLSLTPHQVRKALKKNRARKATGPDGISSRLLKSCADQLCGIFSHMFNLSLRLGRVPQLWKTSCIVPVPKTPHPKEHNSYRPVALTSHLMKTLERLILDHLRPLVSSFMDPLQFAYQPSIGVDDAVIYLLHTSLTHLDSVVGSDIFYGIVCWSSSITNRDRKRMDRLDRKSGLDTALEDWICPPLIYSQPSAGGSPYMSLVLLKVSS
ncbi:hypothetical protein D4764_06G0008490 [Takifugu flavidus]|uniref:Reverse transcriptase domain-containing protein n=1 Tax=Takifugu flavidus TaxID=433684 RepID=A0A5C6MWX4_9TELE|nr:hypothetical protein D4764_06G0008490 [Takifugu flavidus]